MTKDEKADNFKRRGKEGSIEGGTLEVDSHVVRRVKKKRGRRGHWRREPERRYPRRGRQGERREGGDGGKREVRKWICMRRFRLLWQGEGRSGRGRGVREGGDSWVIWWLRVSGMAGAEVKV